MSCSLPKQVFSTYNLMPWIITCSVFVTLAFHIWVKCRTCILYGQTHCSHQHGHSRARHTLYENLTVFVTNLQHCKIKQENFCVDSSRNSKHVKFIFIYILLKIVHSFISVVSKNLKCVGLKICLCPQILVYLNGLS